MASHIAKIVLAAGTSLAYCGSFVFAPAFAQAQAPRNHVAPSSAPASRPSPAPAAYPPPATSPAPAPAPAPARAAPGSAGSGQAPLKGLSPDKQKALSELETVAGEAARDSSRNIFVDPEQVLVKPPLLSALITLNQKMSPFSLDAHAEQPITLRDVLETALSNNLTIKISQQISTAKKWQYVGALSGFLPNLTAGTNFEGLGGNYASPGGIVIPLNNRFLTMTSGFQQYLFQGGGVFYNTMQTRHDYKASQYALKGTVNDVLTGATDLYYNLVLNEALLQIRIMAVEVSKALVIVNEDLFADGVNTYLDVLQAKYQLSHDRQELIAQQVARREAAIKLAAALNLNTGVDFRVKDRSVAKTRLVDGDLQASDLLNIAIDNRPELKRYNQLWLAARDAVKAARAPLMPSVAATGSTIGTFTKAAPLSQVANQQTPLSSSGDGVGAVGTGAGAPLGAASPGTQTSFTGRSFFNIAVNVQWSLGGAAVTQTAKVQAARAEARKAQLEFNRELEEVQKQVRDAYLSSMRAENLIAETTDAVKYAEEGLRLAQLKFTEGVGTYLDVINAQKNYTDALIAKAKAIIQFNVSQARILQAIGRVSSSTLTSRVPLRD